MAARGKTIALSSAGLVLLVLVGAAVASRERLFEAWHIHKLRTGSREEARRAAEALGRMRSVRAVPELLAAPWRSRNELTATGGGGRAEESDHHQLWEIIGGQGIADQGQHEPSDGGL